MNRFKKAVLTVGVLVGFLVTAFSTVNAQGRSVSLQVFYDELAIHGNWINNPDYGYVWRPNVSADFRPYYTNGRWVMTEYGNTWVSNYSWGWAPFHYGRWYYDTYDGWVWLPDTEWGPAWVDWRSGGGYYGWAPMGPRITVNINIGSRYYPNNYWVFIPQKHIYYTKGYHKHWQPKRNTVIIKNTTIINNIYVDRGNSTIRYNSGPRVTDIRNATNRNVKVYKVADANRASAARIDRGTVNVYRPQVERASNASPRNVVTTNTARPSRSETSTTTNRATVTTTNSGRPSTTVDRVRETTTRESATARPSSERRETTIERSNATNPKESTRVAETERFQRSERNATTPQRVERTAAPGTNERPSATANRRPTAERNTSSRTNERPNVRQQKAAPQQVERTAPSSSRGARSEARPSGSSNNSGRSTNGRPSR